MKGIFFFFGIITGILISGLVFAGLMVMSYVSVDFESDEVVVKDNNIDDNNTDNNSNNGATGDVIEDEEFEDLKGKRINAEYGTFTAEAVYTSENNWEYQVKGPLPNPCYGVSVEAIVAESFPEQVTLQVEIINPEDDAICAQVIEDVTLEGIYSASQNASLQLRVESLPIVP